MTIEKSDERVERYLRFYLLRRDDKYSEDQIASTLGFGSPRTLYEQLRADKHPVCPICGALPVEEKHCEPSATPKRQAREGGSKALQLPPAENAMGLITRALNHLLFEVGELKRREERLEGGRFVVEREEWKYWWMDREDFSDEEEWRRYCEENRVDPEVREVFILETGSDKLTDDLRRQNFPEEEWRRLCEEHGVDLEVDEVPVIITPTAFGRFVELKRENFLEEEWAQFCEEHDVPPSADLIRFDLREGRTLIGASRVPPEPLSALVGVYVLGGGALEELLGALHPDPATVDRERLGKIVYRLQRENGRLATLVRGGNPKTGRGPEKLSANEHRLAVYIKRRRLEGAADERILREIRHEAPYRPEAALFFRGVTEEDFKRLGGLDLD